MDAKAEQLLTTYLPIIRNLDMMADTVDIALEDALKVKDTEMTDMEKLERFFQQLSHRGGIKFKTYDPSQEQEYRQYDIDKRAIEMRNRAEIDFLNNED